MLRLAAVLGAAFLLAGAASAHEWYSKYKDPEHRTGCCGGTDCATFQLRPGSVTPVKGGYRVVLTVEEARRINSQATKPIDTFVASHRVMNSEAGTWDICIRPSWRDGPDFGVICLFGPAST